MDVTRAAIEKNRITVIALALIAAAGLQTYTQMSRAEDPGFTIRTALVVTYFPGASPERVELLVTDKVEKRVQEMPELDEVVSQSKSGVSIVSVDIKAEYDDMRPIWDDLRRKVDGIRGELPDGVIGPIVNDEFGDVFGTVITLRGLEDGFTYAELEEVAEQVRDELLLIEEVAKVDVYGAQEERVFVEYSNARLAELGLSPFQLQSILESSNIIIPGGDIQTADEKIVIEPSGNFESVADLASTVIRLPGRTDLVTLEDIAVVRRGTIDPPQTLMRASGEPALGLAVSLREGGNILELGAAVRTTLERLQALYPIGITLDVVQFQADAVDRKISDFVGSLVQAVLIVMAVMLVSLGVRTGLVVASLIPMAIVAALLVMGLFGIGLDQMSLASLIIALGMLVDNAIVMSESIMVQMAGGKSAKGAAIDSAGELRIPLLTSSLTTAAAFLPIYLAESSVGEYTAPLFQVVTITLLCSWVLALTMIPLLCVLFLRVPQRAERDEFDSPFYRAYRGVLLVMLRHKALSVVAVVAVFVGSLGLFRFIPVIFFPPNDRPTFTLELRLPTGSSLAATQAVVVAVEDFIEAELAVSPDPGTAAAVPGTGGQQGVTTWAAFVGRGAPRFILSYNPEQTSPEYAIFVVNATSRPWVDVAVARLREFCRQTFPDVNAIVRPLQLGPPVNYPIEVRISGRDPEVVFAIVDTVKARLAGLSGPIDIADDWGARSKKLIVRIDEDRARRAGVTNQDVAISLQTMLSGFTTTEYREEDKVIPVTLRSVDADRVDIGRLGGMNVFAQLTGRSVPLQQVADVEVAWQPSNIRRRDRLQTVTVQAQLAPGFTAAEINGQLAPWLEEQEAGWGLGYSWEFGGEHETSTESNQSITDKLPIAFLFIVLLLVGQFNSIRRPLIILITIPLGVIGVIVGLLVMGSYFGFMTLLGIISLAGIVINNAIVLIDRIDLEIRDTGLEPARAVVESAQRRLRPILLTTFTTLGGLIPLYLGGGPMWEPMAIAIMFGLVFATILTLGVVPVLYSIFFGVRFDELDYAAKP